MQGAEPSSPPRRPRLPRGRTTKKARALTAWASGEGDLSRIAREVESTPSYVARVLTDAGHAAGCYDLYSPSGSPMNVHASRRRE